MDNFTRAMALIDEGLSLLEDDLSEMEELEVSGDVNNINESVVEIQNKVTTMRERRKGRLG